MNRIPGCFRSLLAVSSLALSLLLPLASGCAAGEAPTPVEFGEATIVLETVPADIACVRVAVAAENREVTRDLEVVLGQTVSASLTGLPVGEVTFSANAYAAACAQVTRSTVPSWVSEPKVVNLVLGRSSSVSLVLTKNGRAKVALEFEDGTSPDAGSEN
jgi:hypothetical protein